MSSALVSQIGIANCGAVLLRVEILQQSGIGTKLGSTPLKLPRVAYHDSGASVHGANDSPYLHIRIPVFAQFTHVSPILPQT